MIYRDFDIRATLCNKVGPKRYQFTVNGVVVHETDDASMYDALSGNEEDWDMEEYQNANGAAEFILSKLYEMYGGVGLKILRGLLGSPNKLPTVMEYTYLLNDYAELYCAGFTAGTTAARVTGLTINVGNGDCFTVGTNQVTIKKSGAYYVSVSFVQSATNNNTNVNTTNT